MTAFWIKIIAIISMTFDHGAYHLMEPSLWYEIMRSFGRLAMPLFSFLIAEGYHYTKSIKGYFYRIFIFGLAIEAFLLLVYFITGDNYLINVNIFLTLSLGLLSLIMLKKGNIFLGILLIAASIFVPVDYGTYGVLLIVGFGLLRDMPKSYIYDAFLIFALNVIFIEIIPYFDLPYIVNLDQRQWYSMLSIIPIALYNGGEGKKLKYFLYIYYPLHLIFIIMISHII